ncbi:DUF202 domain-containing protein [Sulfurimonas sp. SWIR-19]|uniref:YidH family protein n=1 Tax=Sulfurimonas sp. SWIR-19 TaxID=2878390 RepID=UPI001CF2BB56|nr:DUF202 domain-containing protein [Sulfurimonas sp. SWIR-19]UCN01387.1 DUF202 domain-containing protein [Sulfurimonas sp. SWIR-19]
MQEKKSSIDPKDLMAVERATTALIGTSISLIILGFIIEKFELFLHIISVELAGKKHDTIPQLTHIAFYNYLGIFITICGMLLAGYTYKYYLTWVTHLEKGEIDTDKNIYFYLSLTVSLVGFVLLLSMIFI